MSTFTKQIPLDRANIDTSLDAILGAIIFYTADPDPDRDGDDLVAFKINAKSVDLVFEEEE